MKIFLDTANIDEIRHAVARGLDGVTTNPTSAAKFLKEHSEYGSMRDVATAILNDAPRDFSLSVETVGTPDYKPENITAGRLVEEGLYIGSWDRRIRIKIPCVPEGLVATRSLAEKGYNVNVTLVFTPAQACWAAAAGAEYVSPFVGRLEDAKMGGIEVVGAILDRFADWKLSAQVLTASARRPEHISRAYELGSHIATMPPEVYKQLSDADLRYWRSNDNSLKVEKPADPLKFDLSYKAGELSHPLTDRGLIRFLEDAKSADYLTKLMR
jgi:transaldolase